MSFKVFAFLLSILGCLCAFTQDAPSDMKLFLLIGQSNMAGRGKIEEQDKVTNPKIFMLNKEGKWILAKDPVHFDKPEMAGVGLCSQFARDLLKYEPGSSIGLIPCAFGGTNLAQWKPGDKLYNNAVERTKLAMKSGTLAGILWHQGEADSIPALASSYPERFASMIEQLRKDLAAENVILLVGELGPFNPNYIKFNEHLAKIPLKVSNCAMVSSAGLMSNPDNVHFNAESLRTFGSRYAEEYFKLKVAMAAK